MGSIGTATFTFNVIKETVMKDYVIKRDLAQTDNTDLDATPGARNMFEISFMVAKDNATGITHLATLKTYVLTGSKQLLVDENWGINESGFSRLLSITYVSGGHRKCSLLFERSL